MCVAAICACSGCAGEARRETVRDLMKERIDPAADVVWSAVGTTITADGVDEKVPADDSEWRTVRNNAAALVESGRLLLTPAHAKDDPVWITQANALIESSAKAIEAAEARDADAILAVGETIYLSCAQCHLKFPPAPPEPPD